MSLLVTGVFVFCFTHLYPALLPESRQHLQGKLGDNAYRGLFSLLVLGSLVAIVIGWRTATPTVVYAPPLQANPVTSVLILIGLVLFFASQAPGNIKRFIRHPQMTGTILWGIAHLLTNGDSRSVALFGGLTAWAIVEVVMINRRDGQWEKPGSAALRYDLLPLAIGVIVFAAIAYFHANLFGVSALGGQPA